MAANRPSFEKVLLCELALALSPLGGLTSEKRFASFIRQLGWELPDPNLFTLGIEKIAELPRLVEKLQTAETAIDLLGAAVDLFDALEKVFKGISGLPAKLETTFQSEQDFLQNSGIREELPRRLVDFVVANYLAARYRQAHAVLAFLGFIESEETQADPLTFQSQHVRRVVRWERFPPLLRDPGQLATDVYGWGTVNFAAQTLLERLTGVFHAFAVPAGLYLQPPEVSAMLGTAGAQGEKELRIPVWRGGEWPADYTELGLALARTADGSAAQGLAALPYLLGGAAEAFPLGDRWQLEFQASLALEGGLALVLLAGKGFRIEAGFLSQAGGPAGAVDGQARLALRPAPDQVTTGEIVLFGNPGASRVSTADVTVEVVGKVSAGTGELLARLALSGARIVVSGSNFDGFVAKVFPRNPFEIPFDLEIVWSSRSGFHFAGSAGLAIDIPVNRSIFGVLDVDTVHLEIQAAPADASFRAEASTSVGIKLGPVSAQVNRLGLEADIKVTADGSGNLSVLDAQLGFKPPNGAGLAIAASAIVGGGYLFFDAAKEEYAGILQLEFQETITLTAIGLLTTKMPDGSQGFSLLIIISAEDFTPIQLGYGFTLNGIGGLLGVNRTVVVDVLRAGIKNRTLDSVLFPEDPVRNAPQIISNLRAVFPPAENRYVFGPMAIIGWGTPTLVTIELGIVLEFPAPVRLVILGQVRAFLPDPLAPLITLQMDALGVIDFDKGDASVDATLYDSRLIQYVLTGDMALRANWGASPTFVLAVGGLHPRFQPPPNFPKLDRIAVSLAIGDNPRLRLETYLALTSNTAQIGARLELYAKEGGFNIEGWVGFDALFQFEPFQFVADVGGRVVVRRGGNKITSVGLDMTLTGPKPWHARGKAKFEVLSIKHSVRFDARFGQEEELPPPVAVDVTKLLVEAARDVRNWSGQLPQNGHPLVSVRPSGDSTSLLVHPQSELVFRQRVVPLNLTISRFGNTTPTGDPSFALREVKLNGSEVKPTPVSEHFAPAQFFEMSDDEKLSRPSFEPLEAGIRFRTDTTHCKDPVWTPIEYETLIVDPKKAGPSETAENYPLPAKHLPALALLGAAGRAAFRRTGRAKYRAAGPRIAVSDGVYVVATTDKLKKESIPGLDEGAVTYTKAADALRNFLAAHPEQRGSLQIVRDMRGRQDA